MGSDRPTITGTGTSGALTALSRSLRTDDVLAHADAQITPERSADGVERAVRMLLDALGVDEGDHTADTPRRVAAAYRHQLAGYESDPREHLRTTFSAPPDPGLVIESGIRVTSMCAHHLLPITGTATIAYRPRVGQRVVGLSKLARVLDGYARRLQVQEQLGAQVAAALQDELSPLGAGCVITAEHGCMTLRGVMQHGAVTTTTSWTGQWRNGHADRDDVMHEHRASR